MHGFVQPYAHIDKRLIIGWSPSAASPQFRPHLINHISHLATSRLQKKEHSSVNHQFPILRIPTVLYDCMIKISSPRQRTMAQLKMQGPGEQGSSSAVYLFSISLFEISLGAF
jgi:hypothetical protein